MKKTTVLMTAAGAALLASTFACVANETRTKGFDSNVLPVAMKPAANCLVETLGQSSYTTGNVVAQTITEEFHAEGNAPASARSRFEASKASGDNRIVMNIEAGQDGVMHVRSDLLDKTTRHDDHLHLHTAFTFDANNIQVS